MWISPRIVEWLDVSLDTVNTQKQELAALKAERDQIKSELQSMRINFDWLRLQFNQLQLERNALLERAHGIRVPTPELSYNRHSGPPALEDITFEDLGDELAKQLGLPSYSK